MVSLEEQSIQLKAVIEKELNEIRLIPTQGGEKMLVQIDFLDASSVHETVEPRAWAYSPIRIILENEVLDDVDAIPLQRQNHLLAFVVRIDISRSFP